MTDSNELNRLTSEELEKVIGGGLPPQLPQQQGGLGGLASAVTAMPNGIGSLLNRMLPFQDLVLNFTFNFNFPSYERHDDDHDHEGHDDHDESLVFPISGGAGLPPGIIPRSQS